MFKYPIKLVFTSETKSLCLSAFFLYNFFLSALRFSTATGDPLLNKQLQDTSEDKYEPKFASGLIIVKESVSTAKECFSVLSMLTF